MTNLKVLLADDHSVVKYGLGLMLKEINPDCNITQVNSFPNALEEIKKEKFDLLILDINLPGGNNIQMVREIRIIDKKIKILMFSAYEDNIYSERYIKAGANAYLNKNKPEAEITAFLKEIIEKDFKNHENQYSETTILKCLSDRELQIATLLSRGYGNLEIANELDIKMSTISTYKNRIFTKLNISNTVDLIDLMKMYK